MTAQRPSDLQLSQALARRVPSRAPAGLRERILVTVESTPQQRRLPGVLGALFDANPVARRRNLLIAAVVLLVLGLATAAVVGSWLEQRRPKLSLDPPDDLSAYVDEVYRGLADLPPFEMVALEAGDRHLIHSDGRGSIRDERFSTGVVRIVSVGRVVQMAYGDPSGTRTWIEYGRSPVMPGLEVGHYMALPASCRGPWAYLGLGYLLGRPAHGVGCDIRQYWIDIETGIVLRAELVDPQAVAPGTAAGAGDGRGAGDGPGGTEPPVPSAATGADWEVSELRLGPQPEELFSFVPPPGYTVIRADDPACATVWFAICTDPAPSDQVARPFVTPPPATGSLPPAPDPDTLAAEVLDAYARLPAMRLRIDSYNRIAGDPNVNGQTSTSLHWSDGAGRFRTELLSDRPPTIYITTGGHIWISYHEDDGSVTWRDNAGPHADHGGVADLMLGFPSSCHPGWRHAGFELVLGTVTDHLACGADEYWIDVERRLVVRAESHPTDPLELGSSITEVVELQVGPQPEERFVLPPGAVTAGPG